MLKISTALTWGAALFLLLAPPVFMTHAAVQHNPQNIYVASDGAWDFAALAPVTFSWLAVGGVAAAILVLLVRGAGKLSHSVAPP